MLEKYISKILEEYFNGAKALEVINKFKEEYRKISNKN